MTTETQVQHIIIGTAGHIDHGKTSLIARLTGIDTDRLPEEKSRGISIDLGFAHWEATSPNGQTLQFGIVDVPGHERFVKNMVAGATGINIALLVIAADDGVMPQTREHLEIMDLLGVQSGVIAITKTDIVEPDFVELVQAEIEDITVDTFLENCPIVPVSSQTGAGIDELRETIVQLANEIDLPESHTLFRMPIDRVFSIDGHGTIVTGSVLTGDVHPGDYLELLPEGREVRVRSVESHGTQKEDVGARQRTAINLAGLKTGEVLRGQELVTPDYLKPTLRIVVELRSLSSSPIVLKDRIELNLHLGTREIPVRINLKGNLLKPGQRAYAELRMKEPLVASYGQRFILRRISPAITVAGGTILDPFIPLKHRIKDLQAYGAALNTASEIDRLSTNLSQHDVVEESPLHAAWKTNLRTERYPELIEELKSNGTLLPVGSKDRSILIHKDRLEALSNSVMRTIREELERHQPRRALPRNTLNTACREITQPAILDSIFLHLQKAKQLVQVGPNWGPADIQVKLTKKQQATRNEMLEAIRDAVLTPPTLKELTGTFNQKVNQLEQLLDLSVEDGLLIKVADGMFFTPESLESARQACEAFLIETSEATLSQLREMWGVSRKFAVPLCEHFDENKITIRQGDVRVAGPNIATKFVE